MTKLLQATFIDSLLKLKPTSDSKDTKSLRNLYDSIEKCIRNLKSLGITSLGPMLIPCILQKLPEEIRLVVTKNITGDRWDFDEVLKLFNNELTAREKCNFISDTVKKTVNQRNENFYTASSLLTSNRNYKFYCIFCKSSNHKSWNCDVITDVKMRKQIATQQKLCFNCLKTNHQAKKCNSRFTCYKCHEKHNTAL